MQVFVTDEDNNAELINEVYYIEHTDDDDAAYAAGDDLVRMGKKLMGED